MSERRQVPRYIAEFQAEISLADGRAPLKAMVVNISIHGCSVEGAASLKSGQECHLGFHWEGIPFQAEALVTWKSSKGEAGLRFLYVDQKNQELLKNICVNLRLLPPP